MTGVYTFSFLRFPRTLPPVLDDDVGDSTSNLLVYLVFVLLQTSTGSWIVASQGIVWHLIRIQTRRGVASHRAVIEHQLGVV
jgi:hypothetical protein